MRTANRTVPIPALAIPPCALDSATHINRLITQMNANIKSPTPIPATLAIFGIVKDISHSNYIRLF